MDTELTRTVLSQMRTLLIKGDVHVHLPAICTGRSMLRAGVMECCEHSLDSWRIFKYLGENDSIRSPGY